VPTDDEILEQVQLRATAIRRRQRLLVAGSAAVVVVALLGGAVVAGSGHGGGDPVGVAAPPVDRPDPATTTTEAEACATTDGDLGPGSPGPGGSPTAPTDGSGSEASSTSTDSLPARGEPAGTPPAESSIPPDDPPAATLPTVEATTTTCPLQVSVAATYDRATRVVMLGVTVVAESLYDADGFVVWDPADPVRVALGALERDRVACDADVAGTDGDVPTLQRGDFSATHTYPSGGDKEVVVQFWAQRCGGPVDPVEVTVTVPL
jgi:hypothetical protein